MKKRVFLLAIFTAIVSVSSFGQNAKKYYKAGVEFQEGLKYDDAIAQYTSAIGLEPSNPDYYIARGEVYKIQLKYAEAKADYEKAIVFDPKNIDAIVSLGAICNNMGNYEEALVLLNHASGLDKRDAKVYPEKVKTLYELGKFDQALKVSDTAIIIKDTPIDYYWRGMIYHKLSNDFLAKKELKKAISKDAKYADPRIFLAELILNDDAVEAMNQCNEVIKNDPKNTKAYSMRARVYEKNLDYPNALNDISKNILIDPANPQYYYDRGICYQEFNQHTNAINDFSKYIALKPDDYLAYFARAKSYEEIMSYDKAIADYAKITVLSEFNMEARKMLKDATARMYELNREKDPPEISMVSPLPVKDTIEIRGDKTAILITGKIKDKSKLKALLVNNGEVKTTEKNGENEFLSNIDVTGLNSITLTARDDYDNEKTVTFPIKRTEIDPPAIALVAPYTSEDGQVYLDSSTPNIAIQGRISDGSKIKSITIGDVTASYNSKEFNPSFTATLDVSNINKFTVVAEDIYGNKKETEFTINREGALISENNPMGRCCINSEGTCQLSDS
jgi:tetratricopeptide (TPR) repeat protein